MLQISTHLNTTVSLYCFSVALVPVSSAAVQVAIPYCRWKLLTRLHGPGACHLACWVSAGACWCLTSERLFCKRRRGCWQATALQATSQVAPQVLSDFMLLVDSFFFPLKLTRCVSSGLHIK